MSARIRLALEELLQHVEEPPERKCSCFVSPPCNDCVDWGGLRAALEEARAAIAAPTNEADVFRPQWPEGLPMGDSHELLCDDKGHNGKTWLRVLVANDGDAHLVMQEWEDFPEGEPHPIPSLRCRTYQGGGRHSRTHQALLWLAQAIRLDNLELKR